MSIWILRKSLWCCFCVNQRKLCPVWQGWKGILNKCMPFSYVFFFSSANAPQKKEKMIIRLTFCLHISEFNPGWQTGISPAHLWQWKILNLCKDRNVPSHRTEAPVACRCVASWLQMEAFGAVWFCYSGSEVHRHTDQTHMQQLQREVVVHLFIYFWKESFGFGLNCKICSECPVRRCL